MGISSHHAHFDRVNDRFKLPVWHQYGECEVVAGAPTYVPGMHVHAVGGLRRSSLGQRRVQNPP